MKYYKVIAKCGHVGRNNYILKDFYIRALSRVEAAKNIRYTPRVKHHHKDAIKDVVEVCFEEYLEGLNKMASDPYFKATSRTEQKRLNAVKAEEIKKEKEIVIYSHKHQKRNLLYRIICREYDKLIKGGNLYE